MIQFQSDYTEGALPRVLELMSETNMEQTPGYGEDKYCDEAREMIKKICKTPDAYVQFLVGGTQTNTTVITAALRPYEGVIAATTGHINVHETGAIEARGHKVLALPEKDGKITGDQVRAYYKAHVEDESFEHTVRPGMVYISQSTEVGTIYTKQELTDMYAACQECGLYLFIDGARLGYALMAEDCDMTIDEMAHLCDVFYIGGTKVGALFGEAVVINNPKLAEHFRYMIKQLGGMLAKGRLLGLQFIALFEDGLYWDVAKQADALADKIRAAFDAKKIKYLVENQTNQVFPILSNEQIAKLGEKYAFSMMEPVDENHRVVRFCTSWATKEENVIALCEDIAKI